MSTVVWIGRVRRGTEFTTMRKAGLDPRLFFDVATAERFICHHAAGAECPIFAIVAAEGSGIPLFHIPEVQQIIERHGVHTYAVTAAATHSVLDSGMILRRQHSDPPSHATPSATPKKQSVHRDPQHHGTPPEPAGGTAPPSMLSEPSEVFTDSFAGAIEISNDAMVPSFVKTVRHETVQEEIVKTYLDVSTAVDSIGAHSRNSNSSSQGKAGLNDQRFLTSMVNLTVPPPEGIPADAQFSGEGPVGSVWRLPEPKKDKKDKDGPGSPGHKEKTSIASAIRVLPPELQGEPYYSILKAQMRLRHPKITGPLRMEPEDAPKFVYLNAFHSHLERSFRNEIVPDQS